MSDVADDEIERLLHAHGPFEKPPLLRAGDRIGDWKVLAFLGRGGSAEVYRAENCVTGMFGAVKILYRSNAKSRARFKREVQLASELSGASFPKFYGAGEDSGRLYLAEEQLEPTELPCGDAAVASYVLDVARAIDELHGRGFVHRDIKPANVMLRPSTGEYVLIDLGLLKPTDDSPTSRNDTLSVVDGRAVGVGTPGFSAPEQFSGGAIAPTADIHALGVLVNACFNGRPPRCWARIVRQSTSSIPEQRYASVDQFVSAVRHRHRAGKFAVAIALLSAAILGATFWMARRTVANVEVADKPRSILDMRIPDSEARKIFQDTSSENIDTNVQSMTWNELGDTIVTNGLKVTKIRLNRRTLKVKDPVVLDGRHNVYIVGPGLLDADISGSAGVSVHLSRNAALLNRTRIEYPKSAIMYALRGESYINFVNLKEPSDKTIYNVEGDTDVIVRFGGPLSYREVREDEFRREMERIRKKRAAAQ